MIKLIGSLVSLYDYLSPRKRFMNIIKGDETFIQKITIAK